MLLLEHPGFIEEVIMPATVMPFPQANAHHCKGLVDRMSKKLGNSTREVSHER